MLPKLLDGAYLQGVGSVLLGVAAITGAIMAFLARTPIRRAWATFLAITVAPRRLLLDRAQHAEILAAEAEQRASSAEHSAGNWQSAFSAVDRRVAAMELLHAKELGELKADLAEARSEIDALKQRNDALVDYSQLVITYSVHLEQRALAGGVDLSGLTMPRIPEILADRLGIPETLR